MCSLFLFIKLFTTNPVVVGKNIYCYIVKTSSMCIYCERSELSAEFNSTDYIYIYVVMCGPI